MFDPTGPEGPISGNNSGDGATYGSSGGSYTTTSQKPTYDPLPSFRPIEYPKKIEDPVDKIREKGVGAVDWVTSLPGRVEDAGGKLRDSMIRWANQFTNDAEKTAKDNLAEGKAGSYGRKAGRWLARGNNKWYAIGALIVIYLLVKS